AAAQLVGKLAHADAVDALPGEALLSHRAEPRPERLDLGLRGAARHGQALGGWARGNRRTYWKKRARCRSEATSTPGRKRIVSSTGASSAMSWRTNRATDGGVSAP